MTVKPIPDGYHSVTPYLVVDGAAKLVDFIEKAFGGVVTDRTEVGQGRLHAEVRIGDSIVMMGDAGTDGPFPGMIHLYVEDADATYTQALEAGATSVMEPVDQFYGDRMAGVKDQFGNAWYIATHKEDLSKEEMARRLEVEAKRRS